MEKYGIFVLDNASNLPNGKGKVEMTKLIIPDFDSPGEALAYAAKNLSTFRYIVMKFWDNQ